MTKAIYLQLIREHCITGIHDSALSGIGPQGTVKRLYIFVIFAAAAAVFLLSGCESAQAQTPFPSFAYIVGRNPAVDLAGGGKNFGGDGLPDIWIAFIHRNLASALPRGSGYYVKSMKLFHPTIPGYRWDTLPGSHYPMLVVTLDQGREILNHQDGSIAGLNLNQEGRLDLYVSDPTLRMAGGLTGLILELETTDGTIRIPVAPYSFVEHLY